MTIYNRRNCGHRVFHVCQTGIWRYTRHIVKTAPAVRTNRISQSNDVSNFVPTKLPAVLLSSDSSVLLCRSVGASKSAKRFSKGEKRTVAALLTHIKELTKHDSHKSHNRCEKSDGRTDGRTRRESLSPNRNIHGTEQILFWQPSSEESTVERNPPSGLSLIAELQRNYAAWDSSSTTQSVANSRSEE